MKTTFSKELNLKIKGLAYYQIAGGIIGLLLLIIALTQTDIITGPIILFFLFVSGLYLFSIYCGHKLMRGNVTIGLKLSLINQMIQSINFSILGFAFKFASGLLFSVGFKHMENFNFNFNVSLSQIELSVNSDDELMAVGFNLVAIILVYFIERWQTEIHNGETTTALSQSANSISDSSTYK